MEEKGMLNKANKQWSAKRLVSEMEKQNINFNCSVQRGYVWDDRRKSLLIHSMIEDYPIPAFYFAKQDADKYDALDGKQRCDAIYKFMTNEFALSLPEDSQVVVLDDGTEYDIESSKFSNLTDELQQRIKDYSLTLYYFDGITDEEVCELFFRLNNGKPLSAIELTRVKAKSIEAFQQIANHNALQFSVTENGKKRYFDEQLAMQMWSICFSENPSFVTKDFRPLIEQAIVTTSECEKITSCLDKIYDLYQEFDVETKEDKAMLRKLKARTHIVSLVYMAKLHEGWKMNKPFNDLAKEFFGSKSGTSIDQRYNTAAGVGSAKPESVKARMNAINEFMDSKK